jgi:hypothetical protein
MVGGRHAEPRRRLAIVGAVDARGLPMLGLVEHVAARSRPDRGVVVAVGFRQRGAGDAAAGKVPLAVVGGAVARLAQQPRQERRLRVEPVGHAAGHVLRVGREVLVHPEPRWKPAGHDRDAAR